MANSNDSGGAIAALFLFFLGLILWVALSSDANEATVQKVPGQENIDFAKLIQVVRWDNEQR